MLYCSASPFPKCEYKVHAQAAAPYAAGRSALQSERDLAMLERDVRCGYVTREQAESRYGAVFAADGSIDAEATVKSRSDMRAKGLPVDEPIAPMPVFPARMEFEPQPMRNEIRKS